MRHTSVAFPVALVALAGLAFAQAPVPAVPQVAPGHGMKGQLPTTEQWIVHFKQRSFDLAELRQAIQGGKSADQVDKIVAGLRASAKSDQAPFKEAIEAIGGRVFIHYWLINCAAIEVPFEKLGTVRRMPNVEKLEPNLPVQPLIKEATDGQNHNSDRVNQLGFTGKGIATAIVDTGLDEKCASKNRPHQTFYEGGDTTKRNRLLANKQVGTFAPDNTHPHGTGVAGIVAGAKWGNAAGDNGHAPDADVVGYSLSNSASGGSSVAVMARSWQMVTADAVRFKIKTANNSYSGGSNSNPLDAIQKSLDACALTTDISIVVAAGNSGGSTVVSQPAINGIPVGAVNDNSHTMASFSSRGPHAGVTGMFFPDIVACGVSTIMPKNDSESSNYTASGTSMAAPQVCGAATLLRAAVPTLKAVETKAILLASALDISQKNTSPPFNTRNAYGMGLLRDDAAMTLARNSGGHGMAKVTSTAKTWQKVFTVRAGRTYRASIAWMRQDVNTTTWSNLEVEILRGSTVIASSKTPKNLSETAIFKATQAGAVLFRVTGTSIEKDSQDFGWAFTEGSGPPIASSYATFGTGCRSKPQACRLQYSENWKNTLSNKTTNASQICILDISRPETNVCGVDLWTRSRSGNVTVTIGLAELDSNTAKPGKILTSGTVTIGPTAGVYSVRFPPIRFVKDDLIPIVFDNADKLILPATTTGNQSVHYERNGNSWSELLFNTNFQFRVYHEAGAQIPEMSNNGKPVIGTSFSLDLERAPANRAALLFLGVSKQTWGALPLPFTFAPGGCQLLASGELIFGTATSGTGAASLTVPIPNEPALVAVKIFNQYLVQDSVNQLGWIASNAGEGSIGEF